MDCNAFTPAKEVFAINSAGNTPLPLPTTMWNDMAYIKQNQWYCVVGTFSNDILKLYVDGVLRKKFPWQNQPAPSSYGISIGVNMFASGLGYFMNGEIDELRLYDRALSFNEINEVIMFCDSAKTPLSVASIDADRTIRIYPNPVTDILNIELPMPESGMVEVSDTRGCKVLATTGMMPMKLDLQSLPGGLYILKLKTSNQVITRKFYKQ